MHLGHLDDESGLAAVDDRFAVTGAAKSGGYSVIDSLVAASTKDNVILRNVQQDNFANQGYADLLGAGKFGLVADQRIGSVRIRQPGGVRYIWSGIGVPQGEALGPDFYIRIV